MVTKNVKDISLSIGEILTLHFLWFYFIHPEFDQTYVAHLLRLVRQSSLGAIVILAQDQVYDDAGKLMEGAGSFYVPNDYVLRLSRQHKEFLPAVSIHPARPDAIAELDRCVAEGAVMMKCLPNCQNIDCSDRGIGPFGSAWRKRAFRCSPTPAAKTPSR